MEKEQNLPYVSYEIRQASLPALQVNLLRIEKSCSWLAFIIIFSASSSWEENIEREASLSIWVIFPMVMYKYAENFG